MESVVIVCQVIIALGIFNVWLVRYGKATGWRGGDAKNLTEEFDFYGLPNWSMKVIGFLKLLFAVLLVAGIWFTDLTQPAAVGMGVLMLGAVIMHFKVGDPLKKSIPAFSLLLLCLAVAFM